MLEDELIVNFLATFWGKFSLIAGGLFGIGVVGLLINAVILWRRNNILKKLLLLNEKNYVILVQIKELLEGQDDNKQNSS